MLQNNKYINNKNMCVHDHVKLKASLACKNIIRINYLIFSYTIYLFFTKKKNYKILINLIL